MNVFHIPDYELLPRLLWRELVRYRAGNKCERCSRTQDDLVKFGNYGRLVAHHIDRNKDNNVLGNGECLCPTCHSREHKGEPHSKCGPGCECKRHGHAWNRIPEGGSTSCGHNDCFRGKDGRIVCRICRNLSVKTAKEKNPDLQKRLHFKRHTESISRRTGLICLDCGACYDVEVKSGPISKRCPACREAPVRVVG